MQFQIFIALVLSLISGILRAFNTTGTALASSQLRGSAFAKFLVTVDCLFSMVSIQQAVVVAVMRRNLYFPRSYSRNFHRPSLSWRIGLGLSSMGLTFWASVAFPKSDLSPLTVATFQGGAPLNLISTSPVNFLCGLVALIGSGDYLGKSMLTTVGGVALFTLFLYAGLQVAMRWNAEEEWRLQQSEGATARKPSLRVLAGAKTTMAFCISGAILSTALLVGLLPVEGGAVPIDIKAFAIQISLSSVAFGVYQVMQLVASGILEAQMVAAAQILGIPSGFWFEAWRRGIFPSFNLRGFLTMFGSSVALAAWALPTVRRRTLKALLRGTEKVKKQVLTNLQILNFEDPE